MISEQASGPRQEFVSAITSWMQQYGIHLDSETIGQLSDYFAFVQTHNPILHLVGPCSPTEFATRHILESLTLEKFLPENARFADVGPGGGLPSIPCLLARTDLECTLIESKVKKARFLTEVIDRFGLKARASIVNKQFEESRNNDFEFVTCRALDKFLEKLPSLIRWSRGKRLLVFGGPALAAGLRENGIEFKENLMPLSEQRYLFVSTRNV